MVANLIIFVVVAINLLVAFAIVRVVLAARDVRLGRNVEKAARRMKDPVAGELLVTGISAPSPDASFSTADLAGVLSGEGIEPRAVRRAGLVATEKWPKPGQKLPIIVDRADTSRFVVEWVKVKAASETGLEEAERLAAAMRAGAG